MDVNMKFDGSVNSSNQKETESSHHQVPAQKLAKPIHLQRLEKALSLNLLVRQVESCIGNKSDLIKPEDSLLVPLSKQTTRNLKSRVYNVSKVKKSKKWLKNILLEKSSSEDSDQEDGTGNLNESLQEMLNFHKLSLKAKKSSENRTMFREYSSSLLASELNISETNLEPVKRKRPAKSKPKKRPRPPMFSESQQPVAASATSITASVKAEPETKPVLEEVVPLLTQIKIEPVDTIAPSTPLACISPALPCEPSAKRIKKESMVDEIIYDTCLPDEILQSESSLQSEAAPSRAPSVTDEIVCSNQLPDEIFDTEESSASIPSISMSQPLSIASSMAAIMPVPKSATAPPTPSNSCPPSPAQSYPGVKSKSSKKKIATVKERDDVSLDIKRKKLWLLIVRNYVPKRALQVLSTKQEAIFQCRKLASWCEDAVENGPPLMKKEFRELMQNSVREAEHLVCDLERSASVGKFKEMLFYWPQLW